MIYILRSAALALLAGAAAFFVITPTSAGAKPQAGNSAGALAELYARANGALMRGDAKAWSNMVPLSRDFVLFSPFGGKPSRYPEYTPERIERMGKFFRNGSHRQELVQSYVSKDMIVLATIERDTVEVGGLPAQEWALRVTSVFTRDGSKWKLAHRHADPFVEEVPIEQSARIARGEREVPSN